MAKGAVALAGREGTGAPPLLVRLRSIASRRAVRVVDNRLDERGPGLHHSRGEGTRMTAFVELVCRAHTQGDRIGPLITRVDGMWAYCDGRSQGDHNWMRIEPTRREDLNDLFEMPERHAS